MTPVLALLALIANLTGLVSVYDAAADFSIASNPAPGGEWSYGWEPKLGAELRLYKRPYQTLYWGARVAGWSVSGQGPQHGESCCPFVARNISSSTIEITGGAIRPGQLWFHPGPQGEYSVVRWTCPAPGHYRVTARFEALGPATTDVHILRNDQALGEEALGRNAAAHDFSFESLEIYARDRLDFAVGYGANRNYYSDITGLAVTIREISTK